MPKDRWPLSASKGELTLAARPPPQSAVIVPVPHFNKGVTCKMRAFPFLVLPSSKFAFGSKRAIIS